MRSWPIANYFLKQSVIEKLPATAGINFPNLYSMCQTLCVSLVLLCLVSTYVLCPNDVCNTAKFEWMWWFDKYTDVYYGIFTEINIFTSLIDTL